MALFQLVATSETDSLFGIDHNNKYSYENVSFNFRGNDVIINKFADMLDLKCIIFKDLSDDFSLKKITINIGWKKILSFPVNIWKLLYPNFYTQKEDKVIVNLPWEKVGLPHFKMYALNSVPINIVFDYTVLKMEKFLQD